MKQIKLFLLAPALAVLLFVAADKGKDPVRVSYAETITAADLRTHLSILASDEYGGRETCEPGQKMAAAYIADRFKEFGIPGLPTGGYYQEVSLIRITGGQGSFTAGSSNFTFGTDYYYFSNTRDQQINVSELHFAGFGIDDKKYSDFPGDKKQYKDKVLIVLDGEPMQSNGVSWVTGKQDKSAWTINRRKKLMNAQELGVKALLIVQDNFQERYKMAKHSIEGYSLALDMPPDPNEKPNPAVVYISSRMADSLLGMGKANITVSKARQDINATGKSITKVVSVNTAIAVTRKEEKVKTENVLGYIEGSDLKDEVIVITAHYDHLGVEDGVVYNGADDDGSGTVAVIELAEAFMKAKKEGKGPRRSILFMAVSGEEKGLLGSAWYTSHPVFPLEKTTCNLNIDMIGRVDKDHSSDSNYVYVIGSDRISKDLKKVNEAENKKYVGMKLDYRYDADNDPNMFYYRSDHYNFAKNGVPVAFFFNGTHEDYHKETDEVSKINFNLMEKRTRVVFYTAWELANRTKGLPRKSAKK